MSNLLKIGMSILAIAALPACDWMKKKEAPGGKSELAAERDALIRKACASQGTYSRLKELAFDEAARIRKLDPRSLDPLAAGSVVRMEEPLVKSRDEDLNVTVCTGRFILELPPGMVNAFDGTRRLTAEIEYAAQAAADGSGLVYRMDGAEPMIYRLATFGLAGQEAPRFAPAPQPGAAVAQAEPRGAPARPPTDPAPAQPSAKSSAKAPEVATTPPSFNCRYARTATEKMVCRSASLAAKDRQMASLYYSVLANAEPATRNHLRRSRDSFLARREQCGSEECVTAAYNARIAEIRSIADGR
jgi:uncharacterized protein YecT (DUF1311 family)